MFDIYLSPPYLFDDTQQYLEEVVRSGWIAPSGPHLEAFENGLVEKFRYPFALALNSGTAALHLAVKLAGVGPGDQVLIGTFSFIAAANAVKYEGGTSVFLGSEWDTWNLDPVLLERFLAQTEKPVKAVIVTHIFGRPAQMKAIRAICHQYEVRLIEDSAEALGATAHGEFAGGLGDLGVLSFNGNKILTTGGGGALICQDQQDHEKALYWATQAREPVAHFEHRELGYNYRMSSLAAAMGLAQLAHFDELLERKKKVFERYQHFFPDLVTAMPDAYLCENHWLTTLLLPSDNPIAKPSDLVAFMAQKGVETRPFWKPLHLQPLYHDVAYIHDHDVSGGLFDRGVCLPSGAGLIEDQQLQVISWIQEFLQ